MADKVIVTGGGGAMSVFWGLFLFFIVFPVVVVVGCFACTGTLLHQSQTTPITIPAIGTVPVQPKPVPRDTPTPTVVRTPIDSEAVPDTVEIQTEDPQDIPSREELAESIGAPLDESEAPPQTQLRTWHSAAGSHAIEAEFVSMGAGQVKLRRADGSTLSVRMDSLSAEDQAFIRNRGRLNH